MNVGFVRDKSPREMLELFKTHFGEWAVEMGRPTAKAAAAFLNSREAYSARGCTWTEGTLVMALRRYGVALIDLIPQDLDWPKPSAVSANAVNRELRQQNDEWINEQLLKWAKRYTLKLVPSPGKMADELNEMGLLTKTGKMWSYHTVVQTLQVFGYEGRPGLLLEATGWVLGQGRTKEELEAYETELRKEAMRPRYDRIRREGLDVASQLPLQLSLVKNFEGLTEEEAVLKYTVVPWDTLEAVALHGG